MKLPLHTSLLTLAVVASGLPAGPITPDQLMPLQKVIRPQPGESKWAAIPWLTDLQEARRRASAEDRPLFVWRAGGGDVLGRA